MADPIQRGLGHLSQICIEAASRPGDDWEAVSAGIRERLAALPADQSRKLRKDLDLILSFRGPRRDGNLH